MERAERCTGDSESTEADSECETRDCSNCVRRVANTQQEHCFHAETYHVAHSYSM